jgi:molybdopterin synthase sulfur carrier subunit
MKLVYFAWVRERIGVPQEAYDGAARDVSGLLAELTTRDARYAAAFSDMSAVRVAVNQELTDLDAAIGPGDEVAFFPPMTGG